MWCGWCVNCGQDWGRGCRDSWHSLCCDVTKSGGKGKSRRRWQGLACSEWNFRVHSKGQTRNCCRSRRAGRREQVVRANRDGDLGRGLGGVTGALGGFWMRRRVPKGCVGQRLVAWTTRRCRARWCSGGLCPDESRGQLDDVEVDGVNWRGSAGSDRRDAEIPNAVRRGTADG